MVIPLTHNKLLKLIDFCPSGSVKPTHTSVRRRYRINLGMFLNSKSIRSTSITECGFIYVHRSIVQPSKSPITYSRKLWICISNEVITLWLEFLVWKEMILKTPNNIYLREPACYLVLDKETPLEHFSSVFFSNTLSCV